MTNYLKIITLILLTFLISCATPSPEEVLNDTIEKYNATKFISIEATSLWPDMIGEIDTTIYQMELLNDNSPHLGYGFIVKQEKYDAVYIDGTYQILEHANKALRTYDSVALSEDNSRITKGIIGQYNPIAQLQYDWIFLQDSIMNDNKMVVYEYIDMDTVYEGIDVKVIFNLYINPATYEVVQFDRIAYQDDQLGQKIVWTYSNAEFSNEKTALNYDLPEGYVSMTDSGYELVKVGDKAPDFKGVTLAGDSISLSQYLGKKVLLDISVINCGYCKEALKYINESDGFSNNIQTIYINPTDNDKRMQSYKEQINIPFPVIADRKDLGKAYGANGYPTFILIDENGIIEQVQEGYTKEFLDQFM
ncbi:MAG: hypothetical protein CMP48_26920 [Rickettsiales bacterium]|nr:hypothetical protein [Rickettsiales bacterium]